MHALMIIDVREQEPAGRYPLDRALKARQWRSLGDIPFVYVKGWDDMEEEEIYWTVQRDMAVVTGVAGWHGVPYLVMVSPEAPKAFVAE